MNDQDMSNPARVVRILESITDAFIALDAGWCLTYVNDQAETFVHQRRETMLGRSFWEVFPGTIGTIFERNFRRAVAEQVVVAFEEFYPALDAWFEVRAYPAEGGLLLFFQNVNERRQTQDALRDAQRRLEATLEAGGIATWTWNLTNDQVVADANLARLFSVTPEEAAGGKIAVYLQAIHADDRPRVTQAIAEAVASRDTYEAEYRVVLPDGTHRWLATRGRVERNTTGQAVTLPGVAEDITERVERRQREQFLADLAERARRLTDPDTVIADALRSVGQFLGVSRCVFVDIDIEADICIGHPDYRADDTVVSMAGTFPISAFGEIVVAEYGAGRAVAVDDVHTDRTQVPEESIPTYDAVGIRAHASVPVVHSDRLVSCLGVHSATPRRWKPEEVALLQAVVERTWLTVEVARQHRALLQGVEEQRARAERQTLLNRIAQSLRGSADPELVVATAVALLGESLAADRCYFALYDLSGGVVRITHDWHGPDLQSIQGEHPFVNTAEMFQELYHDSDTSIIEDAYLSDLSAQTRANMERLQLRSRISVALADATGLTATLTAAMADQPRAWDAEEVSLVEAVATQLRLGVETARIQQREHRIAVELQKALQPELPGTVPGLAVTKYYEAALTGEAGVGGDFYDVFSLEKGRTALVVGDLSGKGLAAAAQVSIVRNMLRAFLYSKPTLTEAVSELNRVLTENGLLTGFSTLFVSAYDSGIRTLTYVNCGQEPALVQRSTAGTVELLPPTGPILGSFETARYVEQTLTLTAGDALAIFTDGLTEVGPTRLAMLGIEGVMALLAQTLSEKNAPSATERAKQLALALIAGVDAAAQGGVMRDDVCLLVGVVE